MSESDTLDLMRAIELGQPATGPIDAQRAAAIAGLGSKFLAVGSPTSLGLVQCSAFDSQLIACHQAQFGALRVRQDGNTTAELCLASDLVCLSSTAEFCVDWIAEATHLNVIDTGAWSAGMTDLMRVASTSWVGTPRHSPAQPHGSLSEVITGTVSGRMGEEVTVLLYTPEQSPV